MHRLAVELGRLLAALPSRIGRVTRRVLGRVALADRRPARNRSGLLLTRLRAPEERQAALQHGAGRVDGHVRDVAL